MKVFNPNYQINVFADWLGKGKADFEPTLNLEEALAGELTIAAVPYMFDQFEQYKQNPFDYTKFDLLLISDIELNHPAPVIEWIEKLKIKNYLFALGAPFEHAPLQWIYRPWWSFNIINKNNYIEITTEKPLYEFDMLLGDIRPHRNYLMAKLQNSSLLAQSIVTYRSAFNVVKDKPVDSRDSALNAETDRILNGRDLLYPYVSNNLNPNWEVAANITNSVSSIVPWQIYQHTKYSVICETQHREFYLSEKTAKAIFAKRLFVVFSCQHYLKTLKDLGFMTFDNIIDESYDNEYDPVRRFNMAFDQLTFLSKQDYNLILDKSKIIREYNRNHLLKYHQEINDTMCKAVYNKIEEIKKC